MEPHVVILGAGFGGLNAAMKLRNKPCRVTVIDRNNHHLFQPLLYQVATAGLSPGEIAAPIRTVLRGGHNIEVLMAEVTGIDKNAKKVSLRSGRTISYDYLIVATGARHSYFGHPEWEEFAPGLKSIVDATDIRRRILSAYERAELAEDEQALKALLTIVIVGAGPTGVEMAGSIIELARKGMKQEFRNFRPEGTRVLLVEAGPRILAAFPESLSMVAKQALEQLGVEVRTNTRVEQISGNKIVMNGETMTAATTIWAAGVQASRAGEWLGVETDRAGRVPVNRFLQIESLPNVYVIGDTALALDEDGHPLPGVAQVALQSGAYVAKRILGEIHKTTNEKPFHYFDKGTLATIGRAFAVAQIGKAKIAGFAAWIVWVFVHIMYLIGFRNRVLVMIEWAWAYLAYQRGVRLIVEEENK
jgi:NADH dehydrogenase